MKKYGINWRFFTFHNNENYYSYDCITNKIYKIECLLYQAINAANIRLIKQKNECFYKNVIKKRNISKKQELKNNKISIDNNKCCVTLDFSNTCNLDCKYCYRKKSEVSKLSKNEVEKIVKYIKTIYFPSAKDYSFSLGYTSESSLDLDYLIFFDTLIAKYEGYLFKETDFSISEFTEIYSFLPEEIKKKYFLHNTNDVKTVTSVLNDILMNEKLWNSSKFKQNNYIQNILDFTNNPSLSKTVIINRQLINDNFSKFVVKKDVAYMSMSFMTNGTNITNKYIEFIKSIYMTEIWVSLDGPQSIHDKVRIQKNKKGSFENTIKGIHLLQQNGISVNCSSVITPDSLDLLKTTQFLLSENIKTIAITLPRGKYLEENFNKEKIDTLLESINSIYKQIHSELLRNEYFTFTALKTNIFLYKIKDIINNKYVSSRCYWGKEIFIDSKGDWYHCNSTIGNTKDNCGSINKNLNYSKIKRQKTLKDYRQCKYCSVKYLCGGLCYADEINNYKVSQKLECYYRKNMLMNLIKFITELKDENLLSKIIQHL